MTNTSDPTCMNVGSFGMFLLAEVQGYWSSSILLLKLASDLMMHSFSFGWWQSLCLEGMLSFWKQPRVIQRTRLVE